MLKCSFATKSKFSSLLEEIEIIIKILVSITKKLKAKEN